ncbi:MAG TPA: glycosyltransferase family 2 protein [Candidatus Acidoferrales bacterium]|nr:glycosyltransferase family 2 protein [Candidatus Acidoferrales bacterium]
MNATQIPGPSLESRKSAAPAVSVIIPAYNRVHCVAAAVESVFAQTFTDFEIIAVDDGSSDGTHDVLKSFGDRIRLIRQENHGVSSARNTGVRAARGKWVAFLDSDDRWHADKLERQMAVLEKYNARLCFTRAVSDHGEIFPDIEFISATLREPNLFYVENAVDSVCVSPRHPLIPTMVADKALLERVGLFDESFPLAEDAELIFRLSFLSGFLYVDQPFVTVFEYSENSLTYSNRLISQARRNQSYLRLLSQMYWRLVETSPEKLSVMRKRLGYYISRRAEVACAAGEGPVARALARDGILFAGSFRDFVRCAGVLICPGLVRTRARKKWHS